MMRHWADKLVKLRACDEAVEWARTQPDLATAWAVCQRGDWMLWLAGRLAGKSGSDPRRVVVLAACECARLALSYVKKGEERPLRAIETAERWARNEGASLDDVDDTAYAAADAAAAAYAAAEAAAAVYAAYAAADAAAAAYAAADATRADSRRDVDAVADAVADAADAGDGAARSKTFAVCANIVRKHYPHAPAWTAHRKEGQH